ncbi:hypothetical protein DAEQUDRAFT_672534 [Daedalea quercina L-15889]|uniref:Major facilitator superfamily (MFS) profile domain-containing protein n=1 Tax=Daedalea quercina L-15889 TaxID=1314783 RepID=A0A165P8J8_9APHY|nr:hypothetical protein DAEQUDRAFT_672534 [Daedalea quercina L-15889]
MFKLPTKTGVAGLTGTPLIGALTSVCSVGFLLFGYDLGVMSGVVISTYWLEQMGNPSTIMMSTITALYDVGAVIGGIAAACTTEPLGRKRTLILGSTILLVGVILMGTSYERIQMMFARVITGIGIGYITSVTPVYQSEITPPQHRGWQLCCQLTSMIGGIVLTYWVNYAFYFYSGPVQWRFPLLFQSIFAIYVIFITMFMPETPRWLIRHDPTPERGIEVLAKLRGLPKDHPVVLQEAQEIIEAIEIERDEEGSWLDLFKDHGISADKRVWLGIGIQFMQQMTGINIVTYYAPTLFEVSLGMSQERALFFGCWVQVWYMIASFVTWYTIDRIGRRKLWISMALGQMVVLVLEAVCVAVDNPSSNIAAVFFVFLYETCFTWGWMATVWVYPAEILPLKIRAKGAALATASDFLGNFLVVEITPPALQNIGWRTYVIFAALNLVNASLVWAFYPETAGQTLESIDMMFREYGLEKEQAALGGKGSADSSQAGKQNGWTSALPWAVVPRANAAMERSKRDRKAAASADAESGPRVEEGQGVSESIEDEKGADEPIETVHP